MDLSGFSNTSSISGNSTHTLDVYPGVDTYVIQPFIPNALTGQGGGVTAPFAAYPPQGNMGTLLETYRRRNPR